MLQRVMSRYSVENVLSHSKEKFRRRTLLCCVSETSGSEKVYGKEGGRGEYRNFPSNFSCLKLPKPFVGQPFSLSIVSGIEIIYASEGYVTIFRRKIFVSKYRNIS